MRTYDLELADANDNTVALWCKLNEDQLIAMLRTIVLMNNYFLYVRVNLPGEL
jgi:hypothetical protein